MAGETRRVHIIMLPRLMNFPTPALMFSFFKAASPVSLSQAAAADTTAAVETGDVAAPPHDPADHAPPSAAATATWS